MYFAIGLGVLLLCLAGCVAMLRLARTMAAIEELLLTTNEELKETLPEVRGSLGNVNDITAGVNVALRSAGAGASRLTEKFGEVSKEAARELRAGWHGLRVGLRSLLTGSADDGE